jgi:hypothetical protein
MHWHNDPIPNGNFTAMHNFYFPASSLVFTKFPANFLAMTKVLVSEFFSLPILRQYLRLMRQFQYWVSSQNVLRKNSDTETLIQTKKVVRSFENTS